MKRQEVDNLKNDTIKKSITKVTETLKSTYKESIDPDVEKDFLYSFLSEHKTATVIMERERKLFNKFTKYAILDMFNNKIKTNKYSKNIYKDKGISVYKENEFVYKFKNISNNYDESLHELVIGLYGTNFIPSDIFIKIIAGYINIEHPITKEKNYSCVISEYCEGRDIEEWIKQNVDEEDAFYRLKTILFDIVHGLYLAYKTIGFVHHDLHLGNILVRNDDKVKIIDFGRSRMTMKDKVYFYPFNIGEVDHFSDIWEHDIFKMLILIHACINYKVDLLRYKNKLKDKFKKGFVIDNTDRTKIIKKVDNLYARNGFKVEDIKYIIQDISEDNMKKNLRSLETIAGKIKDLKKMKHKESNFDRMIPMMEDLLSFFIPEDYILYYFDENGTRLTDEIMDRKSSFDSFIERFNRHYKSRKIELL